MKLELLSDEFLAKYEDFGDLTDIGKFVYLRTYSRYLKDEGRRETWKETVARAVNFNVLQQKKHIMKEGLSTIGLEAELRQEAEALFDSIYKTNQFISGRTMWSGDAGNKALERTAMANYNCSFTAIKEWDDFVDLFYALLVGTGVGFSCLKENTELLKPIRIKGYTFTNLPYNDIHDMMHIEDSFYEVDKEGTKVTITVGDSKEGWAHSMKILFNILTDRKFSGIKDIEVCYDFVRPYGSPLKTFGGIASGPEPLAYMYENIIKILRNELDPDLDPLEMVDDEYGKIRPIHIIDICNLTGYNVVVGGVRRSAEIGIVSVDDWEAIFAKFGINGIWTEDQYARFLAIKEKCERLKIPYPKVRFAKIVEEFKKNGQYKGTGFHHRRMSNNSIGFIEKPDKEIFDLFRDMLVLEGEPGFLNLYEATERLLTAQGITTATHEEKKEMAKDIGLNPCSEVILYSKGVCNLTTVNVKNFVIEDPESKTGYFLDMEALLEAQQMSARAGVRMTLLDLELDRWDTMQKRFRLTGCSLTGWQDAMCMIGANREQEKFILEALRKAARKENYKLCKRLRIPESMFVTCVKPEGTLSQVAGGVSQGIHFSYSPKFIRRIRINAADPLALAIKEMGWHLEPEIGTAGETYEERMKNARTLVAEFYIDSKSNVSRADVPALEQFEIYKMFQKHYTDMNTSNTITVKKDEWIPLFEQIFKDWDNYVGVSFLSLDENTYPLAPFEAIDDNKYAEAAKYGNKCIDMEILAKYDRELYSEELDDTVEGCEGGSCPVR